jgi:hypothetical protein
VWVLHSSIDWDWEMPGLTLVAVLLAGTLLARASPATTGSTRRVFPSVRSRTTSTAQSVSSRL